jgi:hypothetical protein
MSTPVRMGRVSSREAARPTLVSVSTNGSRPIANASLISNVEVWGKSLADQALSANSARPAETLTAASPASITTCSPGRLRTTSENSRAGTTISPSRSMAVTRLALIESSMSVEKRSRRPSAAWRRMPESTGRALLVDTPRARIASLSTSTERSHVNFIATPYDNKEKTFSPRHRHSPCGRCGETRFFLLGGVGTSAQYCGRDVQNRTLLP